MSVKDKIIQYKNFKYSILSQSIKDIHSISNERELIVTQERLKALEHYSDIIFAAIECYDEYLANILKEQK